MRTLRRPHMRETPLKNMKPSTQDKIEGTARIASGTVKEETGRIIGKPKLEADGSAERAVGHIQKKIGEIEKALDV
jgi:uncharacterized protein YjbJ (UPF0337 family)